MTRGRRRPGDREERGKLVLGSSSTLLLHYGRFKEASSIVYPAISEKANTSQQKMDVAFSGPMKNSFVVASQTNKSTRVNTACSFITAMNKNRTSSARFTKMSDVLKTK